MPDKKKKQPSWTIGIVNYKSLVYFKWQLLGLYTQNNPETFKIIIIDNSTPSEAAELTKIVSGYQSRYGNIKIIDHQPTAVNEFKIAEYDQHGEALNIIRDLTDTEYLLVQDPDFFWLKKDYLNFLSNYLQKGSCVIGPPYPLKMGLGKPDFPACFGCALKVSEIKDINFMGEYLDKKKIEEFSAKYPSSDGWGYSLDVGYRIRERLSSQNYISFSQKNTPFYLDLLGNYTGFGVPFEYFYGNEKVAVHMFGGSRTPSQVFGFADMAQEEQKAIFKQWEDARDRYGNYFYNYLSAGIINRFVKNARIYIFKLCNRLKLRSKNANK